jgi:chemotaxis protein MotB
MAKKMHAGSEGGPPGCPGWMGTYADMITLVLCFFVLLFAFSSLDAAKWQAFTANFTGKEPALLNNAGAPIPNPPSIVTNPSTDPGTTPSDTAWSALFDSITKFFETATDPANNQSNMTEMPGLEQEESQIIITLSDRMLFNPGEYTLRPDAVEDFPALMEHIEGFLPLVKQIIIEGHADTRPVNVTTIIRDNMDLSYQRAEAVRRELIRSDLGLPESMFSSKGQGEEYPHYEPGEEYTGNRLDGDARRRWVDSLNLTAEQRQKNRRVVIILERVPVEP